MKYILATLILSMPILSIGQNFEYNNVFKKVDNLRNLLIEKGQTKILTLTFYRHPSETFPKNDTCFDCLSGYVFWQSDDTTFCTKFNREGSFYKENQPIKTDNSDLNFSEIFNCIESSSEILFTSQIRPSNSDLIDTSNFEVLLGDTVYLTNIFSCADCKSAEMRLYIDGNEKKYTWQSIHFDKTSNRKFYYENLNSRIYHLYLLTLRNINHYDRNEFWEKK